MDIPRTELERAKQRLALARSFLPGPRVHECPIGKDTDVICLIGCFLVLPVVYAVVLDDEPGNCPDDDWEPWFEMKVLELHEKREDAELSVSREIANDIERHVGYGADDPITRATLEGPFLPWTIKEGDELDY